MKLLILVLSFLASKLSMGAQFQGLQISGKGCGVQTGSETAASSSGLEKRFKIPLQLSLNKNHAASLERKTCNFSLPILVARNEKIKITNLVQHLKLRAFKGTQVKAMLALFAAGHPSQKPMVSEAKGLSSEVNVDEDWAFDGVLLETKCGQDVILRGNLNVVAQGDSKASAQVGDLLFSIESESCR